MVCPSFFLEKNMIRRYALSLFSLFFVTSVVAMEPHKREGVSRYSKKDVEMMVYWLTLERYVNEKLNPSVVKKLNNSPVRQDDQDDIEQHLSNVKEKSVLRSQSDDVVVRALVPIPQEVTVKSCDRCVQTDKKERPQPNDSTQRVFGQLDPDDISPDHVSPDEQRAEVFSDKKNGTHTCSNEGVQAGYYTSIVTTKKKGLSIKSLGVLLCGCLCVNVKD